MKLARCFGKALRPARLEYVTRQEETGQRKASAMFLRRRLIRGRSRAKKMPAMRNSLSRQGSPARREGPHVRIFGDT